MDIYILCSRLPDLCSLAAQYAGCCTAAAGYLVKSWRDVTHAALPAEALSDLQPSRLGQLLEGAEGVVMEGSTPRFRHAGCLLSRQAEGYLCNIWLNTEGEPMLDSDCITKENAGFYQTLLRRLHALPEKAPAGFRYAAIGAEADLAHCPDMRETVRQSRGVTAWVLNRAFFQNPPADMDGYTVRSLEKCWTLCRVSAP